MAAVDYFLKLDGIDGESTKNKAEGQIELLSWSFGAQNASSGSMGSGHGTGKVKVKDLVITKSVDKASPLLFLSCCQQKNFTNAKLQGRLSTGGNTTETYLEFDLSNAVVTSVDWDGTDPEKMKATETVSIAFQKIVVSYWPQNKDGKLGSKIPAGWDVSTNSKI